MPKQKAVTEISHAGVEHPPLNQAWLTIGPSLVASFLAVYIVHRLTKSRDREKLLDDFHSKIENAADLVVESAYLGWSLPAGPKRQRQIAITKSNLQKLGSLVNRLELISAKRRWRWKKQRPLRPDVTIIMGSEIVKFRQAITADPFENPSRTAANTMAIDCESAKSVFLMSLDLKYRFWFNPF